MADAIIESSGPSVSIASSGAQSAGSHMNPIVPIISAEIQIETNNPPPVRPPTQSAGSAGAGSAVVGSGGGSGVSVGALDDDSMQEPEAKRKRLDPPVLPSTSSASEKLELRLGGILCCAVCLDLPKTAMYQVGIPFIFHNFNLY